METVSMGSVVECDVCHGTGWELYTAKNNKYLNGEYELEYARPCWKCSGRSKPGNDLTGVPEIYRDADVSKIKYDVYEKRPDKLGRIIYSFVHDFDYWQRENKGLYLWSNTPGSGKTLIACCCGKSVMVSRKDFRFRFVTAINYMNKVADSYKRDKGFEDPTEIYRTCELLVLDDVGAQLNKEWQQSELFRLINARTTAGLITIYTSNYDIDKLNLDDRTKNRIMATSVVWRLPEESIRRKKGEDEQNAFIGKMLND